MIELPSLPYVAPWFRVARSPGKVVLEHAQRIVCLEGASADRFLPALLPLLDGTRTVDEVVRVLGEPTRPAVESAIGKLAEHGVLIDGPPAEPGEPRPVAQAAQLLTALHPGGRSIEKTLSAVRGCSVGVAGDAPAGIEAARLLRCSGVDVERVDGPAVGVDLTICAPAGFELVRLAAWNEMALAAAAPWLQVLPFDGRYAAIGPLYLPGDTGCHECFRLRRSANLDAGDEQSLLDTVPSSAPTAPAVDTLTGALAAQLALGWLVHGDHYAPAAFYALELVPTISLSVNHVHRVPRCRVCSGLSEVAPPLPWHKEVVLDRTA